MSTLIRKKKGNLVLAILMFLIALSSFIAGMFIGPISMEILGVKIEATMGQLALGQAFGFDTWDTFVKTFSIENINWFYLISWIAPVITSLLALILRRYRLVNLLNFVFFGLATATFIFGLFPSDNFIESLKNTIASSYIAIIGIQFVGSILAFVNTELCR